MNVKIVATISERLTEAMQLRKMKQVDLANITGIDKGSISQYVSGKYSPKGDKLYKLATALNVSSAWLSGFNVPMQETFISNEGITDDTIILSEHEKRIIVAYRNHPEMQAAVDTLLKVTKSDDAVIADDIVKTVEATQDLLQSQKRDKK